MRISDWSSDVCSSDLTRIAVQQAGDAAEKIGDLAATTNGVLSEDVRPAMANLNDAIKSAKASTDTLNAAIGDARPGLQAFSKQTVPEVGQLVQDRKSTRLNSSH